jgi:hypothetical protein
MLTKKINILFKLCSRRIVDNIVFLLLITLDNIFSIFFFFVSAMNMLLIYLFASMKLQKGHKKNYLSLVLKLCYTMIFYELG